LGFGLLINFSVSLLTGFTIAYVNNKAHWSEVIAIWYKEVEHFDLMKQFWTNIQ